MCLKCLGSQMLTRYFILWRSHCLKTVKQLPRFIHRKLKRETLSPVLNLCSLQPQHTTSPESWLQKIKSSFIPPFIQCMCNELSDMQATPFIRGSKKRRKNLLEINLTGSRIVSDYSTESTHLHPKFFPILIALAALISSVASHPIPHPRTHANDLGRAQNANGDRKTWQRGLWTSGGLQGRKHPVHRFLEHWEVGPEVHPDTDVLWEGDIFTVWRDRHDGRGQTKQALGRQAARPQVQAIPGRVGKGAWVAAAPCTEKTRRAPEHSRHFLWLGACWQVMGAEQHRKWLRGPKGWFMKQDE